MKPKTLIILGTLTALLGAFVYFVERDLPSTDEKKELETKVLALETDDVDAVTLRMEDREVRLEKVEKEPDDDESGQEAGDTPVDVAEPEWRIVSPIEARADAQAVRDLLAELMGLSLERTLEDVAAEAAGLDEPRAVVVVSTKDGEATLEVGADVPLSEDALVRVAGDTGGTAAAGQVVQTGFGEALRERVGRDAGDWRDKRLFFARRGDVQQLAWTGPEGRSAVLTRAGDGDDFFLDGPVQDRADKDKVRGLLSSLTSLEAASFVDDEAARASFEGAARFEVTIEGQEAPWVLDLAELDAEQPLARVDGTLVRLASGPVTDAVADAPDDWRSTAWTHQQTFQIDEAIIEQEGEELLAVRRHESGWLRTTGDDARVAEARVAEVQDDAESQPPGEEVPYTAASNVIYPLTEVKAERLVPSSEAADLGVGVSEPQLTVTLVSEDGEETLRLYGRTEGGHFAARTDGRDVVLLLPAEKVDELLAAVQALRDAEPVPPPATAAPPEDGENGTGDDGDSEDGA